MPNLKFDLNMPVQDEKKIFDLNMPVFMPSPATIPVKDNVKQPKTNLEVLKDMGFSEEVCNEAFRRHPDQNSINDCLDFAQTLVALGY